MSGHVIGPPVERRLRTDDEREAPPTASENFVSLPEHDRHTEVPDQEGRDQQFTHLRTCSLSRDQNTPLQHGRHGGGVIRETSRPIRTDLSDLSFVLRGHVIALNCLHESGWIHRDISAGSVYFFGRHELVRNLKCGSHIMRTGTPYFMAVEVSANSYRFMPWPKESASDISKRMKLFEDDSYHDQPEPRLPFVQNEGHDIESLWWISNYILFFNHDDSTQETRDQDEARMVWMPRIFPSSNMLTFRDEFLRDSGTYEENTEWFSSSFLRLRSVLKQVRRALIVSYTKMEAMLPNVVEGVFNDLYDVTIEAFRICMSRSRNIAISSSFKTKGRNHQKDLLQTFTPPPPPADDEN